MKIHLIGGPGHNWIVEHSEINRAYYFNYPTNELEIFRYYIYIFYHRTNDGMIHFKCENP